MTGPESEHIPKTSDSDAAGELHFSWIEDLAGQTGLSPREAEIARMVAKGLSNKQIAAALGISAWTVSTHLRRMYAKLDVHSRAGMVARIAVGSERPRRGEYYADGPPDT